MSGNILRNLARTQNFANWCWLVLLSIEIKIWYTGKDRIYIFSLQIWNIWTMKFVQACFQNIKIFIFAESKVLIQTTEDSAEIWMNILNISNNFFLMIIWYSACSTYFWNSWLSVQCQADLSRRLHKGTGTQILQLAGLELGAKIRVYKRVFILKNSPIQH